MPVEEGGHPLRPPTGMSEAEWAARLDCAALYRLVALQRWDDLIFTHLSVRVPGERNHFLINPYGWLFEEITASSLVKIDLEGHVVAPTPHGVNRGAFVIHSAIHGARADAECVIHLHTPALVGVSSQAHGLLPLTQTALLVLPRLAYHDYEGATLDTDERARLASDLGSCKTMLLRHHGGVALGLHVGDAFMEMYFLQSACEQQIACFATGPENVIFPSAGAQQKVLTLPGGQGHVAQMAWPALRRRVDRLLPGYDA